MKITCKLCKKSAVAERGYCGHHDRAFREVERKFAEWRYAVEDISWERYLETIAGMKETGDLARAVAKEEMRQTRITNQERAISFPK